MKHFTKASTHNSYMNNLTYNLSPNITAQNLLCITFNTIVYYPKIVVTLFGYYTFHWLLM